MPSIGIFQGMTQHAIDCACQHPSLDQIKGAHRLVIVPGLDQGNYLQNGTYTLLPCPPFLSLGTNLVGSVKESYPEQHGNYYNSESCFTAHSTTSFLNLRKL